MWIYHKCKLFRLLQENILNRGFFFFFLNIYSRKASAGCSIMTDPPNVGHVEMKSPQIEIGGTLSGKGRRSVQLISKNSPRTFLSTD